MSGVMASEKSALVGVAQKEPPTTGSDGAQTRGNALHGYSLMFLAGVAEATRCLLFHAAETLFGFPVSLGLLFTAAVFTVLSGLYVTLVLGVSSLRMPRGRAMRLCARGLLAAIAAYGKNLALAYIPLGTELTIFSTSPVIAAILAAAFLGDALTWVDALILATDVVGVILVSSPALPGNSANLANADAISSAAAGHGAFIGIIAAIVAAVSSATGLVLVRVMGDNVHVMHNLLATGLGCFIVGFATTSASDLSKFGASVSGTSLAFGAVMLGFTYQTFVNRSLQLCRPGPALVVRSFNVPVSFILGLVFMGEGITLTAVLGVLLVLSSIAYIGLGEVLRETGILPERPPRESSTSTPV